MRYKDIRRYLKPYSMVASRATTINHAFAACIAPCDKYDEEVMRQKHGITSTLPCVKRNSVGMAIELEIFCLAARRATQKRETRIGAHSLLLAVIALPVMRGCPGSRLICRPIARQMPFLSILRSTWNFKNFAAKYLKYFKERTHSRRS